MTEAELNTRLQIAAQILASQYSNLLKELFDEDYKAIVDHCIYLAALLMQRNQ